MCEADVYINRAGKTELLMEKVDRIIPGEEDTLFLESVFGERRVVKAKIQEMELVHHRIVLADIDAVINKPAAQEIWLEAGTDHGHFHEGEEVHLKIHKGHNMRPDHEAAFDNLQAFINAGGQTRELTVHQHHGAMEVIPGQEADGLIQIFGREKGSRELYAKILVEIGHHDHHGVEPLGLPLEIVPCDYSHARLGEKYEILVLKDGSPAAELEVGATYAASKNNDYPYQLKTNAEGKASLFLTGRGNYLFSVSDGNITSTFTLMKSF